MIYIKIPTPPQKSDFGIDDDNIKRAEKINENIKEKHQNYDKNNANISYVLAYIIVCIITGWLIRKYNYQMSDMALIFISCIVGLLIMAPIGFFISYLLQNIGKEIEPNRIPKKDNEYSRSNAYIQAKSKYENEIARIKRTYPLIDECNFDLQKYNDYWINYFKQQINIMIRNKRRETLRKITICGDKYFDNLDLIGCKNVHRIDSNLYTAERMQNAVLITYLKLIQRSELDEFILALQNRNNIKGIIITEENWHKDSWFIPLIQSNNIELIHVNSFEEVVTREINRSNFIIQPNDNNTPYPCIDIQYTDICGYKLYGGGRNYVGFYLQLITEVFTSKKEIFEKIKNIPKQKGTYGIIKCHKYSTPIYGLVFFKQSGEIHYFMRYFCAAIDNETKRIANIVTGSQRMRYDCGDYWYQNWSEYCWED